MSTSLSVPSGQAVPELLRLETRNLLGFLLLLVGDRNVADDLFQETCVTILELRDRFEPGTDFGAWVRGVARIHVLRHRRSRGRGRALAWTDAMMERLESAWQSEPEGDPDEERRQALSQCVRELAEEHRNVLALRYERRQTHERIGEALSRTPDAIKMLLSRLRKKLRLCVEMRRNEEELRRMEGRLPS